MRSKSQCLTSIPRFACHRNERCPGTGRERGRRVHPSSLGSRLEALLMSLSESLRATKKTGRYLSGRRLPLSPPSSPPSHPPPNSPPEVPSAPYAASVRRCSSTTKPSATITPNNWSDRAHGECVQRRATREHVRHPPHPLRGRVRQAVPAAYSNHKATTEVSTSSSESMRAVLECHCSGPWLIHFPPATST